MAMVPDLLNIICDIHANNMFLKGTTQGILMFKHAKQNFPNFASSPFSGVKFPKIDTCEHVDTDEMKESLLSLLETLHCGKFDNIFETWPFIWPGPLLPPNFDRDDLRKQLTLFLFESDRRRLVWGDTPKHYALEKHFNKPPGHFSNIPENDKCFKITIHKDYAEYVFEPIVNDVTITEGPPWAFPSVAFLKLVIKSKEWHHNMTSQSLQNEDDDNDEN
jgi:hypothetical protein